MSHVRMVGLLGALSALVLTLGPPAHAAPARPLYVGQCQGPSPYATVQSAVDAAADGATILLCPETYREQVRISGRSGLTVRAPRGATIDATALLGPVVTASTSPDLKVRGLTLRGATSGVQVSDSPRASLLNNELHVDGDGLVLLGSPGSRVMHNVVGVNRLTGILVSRSDGTRVVQNWAEGGQIGLAVYESSGAKLLGNRLSGRDRDAVDNSSGKGTAGTADRWQGNTCETSAPPGLCAS